MSVFKGVGDTLFAFVGTSGSMVAAIANYLIPEETRKDLKLIAFASELDIPFLTDKMKICMREDTIEITGPGTGGDPEKAERAYLSHFSDIQRVLERKQPFSSAFITCFGGGGTSRCAYLFARDLLEKFSVPGPGERLPKILVSVKLPAHDEDPKMLRNTLDLLGRLSGLYKKYKDQLAVVVFSDGVGLRNLTPTVRGGMKHLRYPDTVNAPIGDWIWTIVLAYSLAETNLSDFFSKATQLPFEGEYGPFGIPIIIRAQIEDTEIESSEGEEPESRRQSREKAKSELYGKIQGLESNISLTTMTDINFGFKERVCLVGCLWAPEVEDPEIQQQEVQYFQKAIKEKLLANEGVEEAFVHLKPLYSNKARTIDILGALRGVKFWYSEDKKGKWRVDSEIIEAGKTAEG
jgi:hypothetical protein